jgi:hypothetical protein
MLPNKSACPRWAFPLKFSRILKKTAGSMRVTRTILALLAACLFHAVAARADHAPTIIVPGNPNIPVIINGYDMSWGIAEGDWGLYRPGAVAPSYIPAYPAYSYVPTQHYFPFTGRKPLSGRYEVNPPANRRLPPPAESFYRYWSAPPSFPPATINDHPSFAMPPVIVTPRVKD